MWSLGVIIWELCALDVPFKGMTTIRVAAEVAYKNRKLVTPSRCHPFLADLMHTCFHDDPADRPTFADVAQGVEHEIERRKTLSKQQLAREELALPSFLSRGGDGHK